MCVSLSPWLESRSCYGVSSQVLTKLMGLGFKCGDMDSLFVFMNTNLHPQGIHLQQALDFAVTCNLELKAPVEALQRVYDQFCLVDLNRHGFIKVPVASAFSCRKNL